MEISNDNENTKENHSEKESYVHERKPSIHQLKQILMEISEKEPQSHPLQTLSVMAHPGVQVDSLNFAFQIKLN
jgi:hypothetical protein